MAVRVPLGHFTISSWLDNSTDKFKSRNNTASKERVG